ncbi:hypothetical protein BaRGS_00036293 [Batillaria attramentaria]|uniref:Uncharacterized protein n=1 Tax=Batillaria attramentaria TaxID=370345 RepID=A0ABD0JC61_9CAEN
METKVSLHANVLRNEPVTWTIRTLGATTERHLGTCSSTDEVCSSSDTNSYGLTRLNSNQADESYLTILNNHREMFSETSVKCKASSGDFAACIISVIHPATLSQCSIHSDNTTLTGSCRVDKAFSSNGNYSCQWGILYPNTNSTIMMPSVLIVTNYSDSGKQYYQGVCSFSYPLPQWNGAYSLFFSMFPSGPNHAEVGQFTMHSSSDPPDQPVITGYTTGQILELGHRLEMVCTVHGGSSKVSSIDFTCTGFDDREDTSNETSVSSSVIIQNISEADDQRSKTYDHPRRRREEDTHPYTGLRPPRADGARASGTANPQGVYEEIEAEQRPQLSTANGSRLQTSASQGNESQNGTDVPHFYQNAL